MLYCLFLCDFQNPYKKEVKIWQITQAGQMMMQHNRKQSFSGFPILYLRVKIIRKYRILETRKGIISDAICPVYSLTCENDGRRMREQF